MDSNAAKSLCGQFALRNSRECGFTLVELMIAVAVVGILAAVAVPAYSDYVTRGKIPEATSTLASMRVKLEQYYQDNRSYGSSAAGCGVSDPTGKYFDYSCVWGDDSTPQTFKITASGKASQGMSGFVYTLNEKNEQTSTAWGAPSVNCWVTKKGQPC
jgi:type IV pilus assembly protein PilE